MRRIAISNLAWAPQDDEAVAEVLRRYEIDAIETVVGRRPLRGFEVIAAQALFTGTDGLNIFRKQEKTGANAMKYLADMIFMLAKHKVNLLVFGSPRQRDRGTLSYEEAFAAAVTRFRRLGEVAYQYGTVVCIEPAPEVYGCNFINTTEQAADLVEEIDHPAIRLQLDTGAMAANHEDPAKMVSRYMGIVGHVHISEPGLVQVGMGGADHRKFAKALPEDQAVSIEMKPFGVAAVQSSIWFAKEVYT